MNLSDIVKICNEGLDISHRVLYDLGESGTTEVKDDKVTDISTQGDRAITPALIEHFRRNNMPARVVSEETASIDLVSNPEWRIAIDDIDGTNNYARGIGLLPYCTVISVAEKLDPKFEDIVYAGIIAHHSREPWVTTAIRGYGAYLNMDRVKPSSKPELDKKTLVIIDTYGSGNDVQIFSEIIRKGWIKDFGSSAFHLGGVGTGIFDAFVNAGNKGDELGAGYLLIKEAGGYLSDFDGKPLDGELHIPTKKYQIIAAGNELLGCELLKNLE